jgi:CubicO group peptidase (beta-lactamase class C family)
MRDTLSMLVTVGVGLYVLFLLLPILLGVVQWFRLLFVKDPAGEPMKAEPRTGDLADVLEPVRRKFKVPALAAALVRDGNLAAVGAVGVRKVGSPERVTPDDRFHLGSCGKAMTATVCARLVEQGKLRWNSTVAEVFPDLAEKIDADFRPATLEHLLTHRAGISEGVAFNTTTWPKIWELTGPLDEQRRQVIELVLRDKPAAPLGTAYEYSNCGYAIAGAMCERVAGRPWEELMRELLFDPLGMATAGFGPPGTMGTVDQPWGHRFGFFTGKWTPMPPEPKSDNPAAIGPAGRIHCTLADWAAFAALHLRAYGGDPLIRADTVRLLHSPTLGGDYAFGWTVQERDWAGGKVLTHTGSNTMWYAVVWLAPARNFAVLAATNLGTQAAFSACDAAVSKLIEIAGKDS